MNKLRNGFFIVGVLSFLTTCCADFQDIGEFGTGGSIEEGRFLGLLKKGKGHVETYTNYVPYPYPVPVAVPIYPSKFGHGGKLGFGKGVGNGFGEGFGQGYYPNYNPYQYYNNGPVGYGGLGSGYGYFK